MTTCAMRLHCAPTLRLVRKKGLGYQKDRRLWNDNEADIVADGAGKWNTTYVTLWDEDVMTT